MSSQQSSLNADGSWSISDHPEVDGREKLERELSDAEIEWGITAEELERRRRETAIVTESHERRCHECGNRVTETPAGFEAGHGARKNPCSQWTEPSRYIDIDEIAELDDF